jgi:hypothetical protein
MREGLLGSLTVIDTSGYLIITAIVVVLLFGVGLTVYVRARYRIIERELKRHGDPLPRFASPVLNEIVREVQTVASRQAGELNTQAIVEHKVQTELSSLLLAERFIKTSTGLMIIMGLVGTFYGLTLSIGKLVALVSEDAGKVSDITASVTAGLTEALSGMSVAFSTSLFGITGAIVMTLLSVFANVPERRTAVMLQIEVYIDTVVLAASSSHASARAMGAAPLTTDSLERATAQFARSIGDLGTAMTRFETALTTFSSSNRDFREFNLHLKDNIQRMSLSFGDLSDTLQRSARVLSSDADRK